MKCCLKSNKSTHTNKLIFSLNHCWTEIPGPLQIDHFRPTYDYLKLLIHILTVYSFLLILPSVPCGYFTFLRWSHRLMVYFCLLWLLLLLSHLFSLLLPCVILLRFHLHMYYYSIFTCTVYFFFYFYFQNNMPQAHVLFNFIIPHA